MENQKQSIREKFVPGAIIGGLKIIEKIENKNRYKVQCILCNDILNVHEDSLRNRLKDSEIYGCAKCTRQKIYKSQIVWKEGDIIGDYKLIFPHVNRQSGLWNVECLKCGSKLTVSLNNAKKRKRSGCYYCNPNPGQQVPSKEKEQGTKPQIYSRDELYYRIYKNKIENLNKKSSITGRKYKEWKLSLKEFSQLIHDKCVYCGAEPEYKESFTTKSHPNEKLYANGIDRIDSNKGYTIDNCVSCCTICNRMKLDLNQQEFYNHITKILQYSNKCSTTIETASDNDEKE